MSLRYQNGFLVQHLYDQPYGMENIIKAWGYHGLSARNSNPLSMLSDQESRELSYAAQWREVSERRYVLLEFISDPKLLLRYIRACRMRDIPIRLLYVQSDYREEVWTGPDMPKEFLGYEYSTIPIDNQVITDLFWYRPLAPFAQRLNSWGLFPTLDDAELFKQAYDAAFARGEIGDGDMDTHIFSLFAVNTDDALRCLTKE